MSHFAVLKVGGKMGVPEIDTKKDVRGNNKKETKAEHSNPYNDLTMSIYI